MNRVGRTANKEILDQVERAVVSEGCAERTNTWMGDNEHAC